MSSGPLDRPRDLRRNPWMVVGLLWFCGFFNYADRIAVYSVFPMIQDEFGLSKADLGAVSSSFMIVYALMAPLAGYIVDRRPRRGLIVLGLGFWSLVCAGTALARNYGQLLFFRAAEGLGESFYFPASMSLLSDYHTKSTRSKAMGLHQTSVYLGTIGGAALAGWLGSRYGWRTPFWGLGVIGMIYALALWFLLIEPTRGKTAEQKIAAEPGSLWSRVALIFKNPAAVMLLAAFGCANFVATSLLTWLPMFVYEKFALGLTNAALTGTVFLQLGSVVGALFGGWIADRAAVRAGGRMWIQALALLLAAPCVFQAGTAATVLGLGFALVGIGITKGIYDSNIFASMYDVIPVEIRGTAAGVMNTVGWSVGSLAPWFVGIAGDRYGLGQAIGSTAAVYLFAALFAFAASVMAARAAA